MARVSNTVNDLIGRVCPAFPFWLAIKEEWENVVGEEMARLTSLPEIKFGMSNELNVFVEVLDSASIMFKYNVTETKDKISKITGYSVMQINLIIKQVITIDAEYKNAA